MFDPQNFIADYAPVIALSFAVVVVCFAAFFIGVVIGRRLADRDVPPESYGPFGDDHGDVPNIDASWGGR